MTEIFILLIAFQIKHFLADYPLQLPYMYTWKGMPTHWVGPLADHASVHMLFTFFISITYLITTHGLSDYVLLLVFVTVFDATSHFFIDRWKATQKGGPDTSSFWIKLGIDQMLHHLVSIFIVYALVQY